MEGVTGDHRQTDTGDSREATTVSGDGRMLWSGGTISGNDISVPAELDISGGAAKTLDGITLAHGNTSGGSYSLYPQALYVPDKSLHAAGKSATELSAFIQVAMQALYTNRTGLPDTPQTRQ